MRALTGTNTEAYSIFEVMNQGQHLGHMMEETE